MNNECHHDDPEEEVGENHNDDGDLQHEETVATLQFPIRQPTGQAPMKNISPSVLPRFHGKATEDPDEFLFEFDILCQSYDYTSSEKKLNHFPATLKYNALHWFMSLRGEAAETWEKMKHVFLGKYQEYCRTKDKKEEIFNMVKKR